MAVKYGWMGTILRVNLSERRIVKEPLTEDLAHKFVGGRGINSKILYDETGPHTKPLGPDNRLIIGAGPVTGTIGPSAARFTVTAKSPLTGILGDASGGGFFIPELKFAGYDHIVIQGKAESPVYLWINDDEVEIRDASHIWGRNTWDIEEAIRKELGDRNIKTLCIGQAGEHMVRTACTIGTGDRAPGKTGTGAVMGSKNLKAIAIRGSKSVKVAHPEKYKEIVRKWYEEAPQQGFYPTVHKIGTSYLVKAINESYTLGVRNVQELHLPEEKVGVLYGENFVPKYGIKSQSCFACPISCSEFLLVKEGPYAGEKGRMPEGGSLIGLGPLIGVSDDFPFVLKVTNLCNQYGLDSGRTAASISAAMEWFQRGIITREDSDELELKWGDQQVIVELLRKIAYREGFGDILAEGALNAAQKIGKGAEKYVLHSKKMPLSTSRRVDSLGSVLAQSTATRGFDHLRGLPTGNITYLTGEVVEIKGTSYDPLWAKAVQHTRRMNTASDMLEICKFNTEWEIFDRDCGVARMAELLAATTGLDFSEEWLTQATDRVYCIEKSYNAREGIRREDDSPPR
ncbi:aldehyde ferredoxin oxidoreductase family protein, partial [Candidatus Omnitrophota bacterium]